MRRLVVVWLLLGAAPAHAAPRHGSITADLDCSACHSTGGWTVAGGRGFDHARTGFPLTGAHRGADCASCHRPEREITRVCAGCHRDPHEGRLGDACDGCHTALAWPAVRASERHRRTRLPLTGVHALLECTECHRRTTERAWSDVPADCFACHEDDVRRDIHPDHVAAGFPRDCGRCHRPIGWSPAVIDAEAALRSLALRSDHEARFPIATGKHRGLPCASCHPRDDAPRIVGCAGCHEPSRHPGRPGGACLSCHPGGRPR